MVLRLGLPSGGLLGDPLLQEKCWRSHLSGSIDMPISVRIPVAFSSVFLRVNMLVSKSSETARKPMSSTYALGATGRLVSPVSVKMGFLLRFFFGSRVWFYYTPISSAARGFFGSRGDGLNTLAHFRSHPSAYSRTTHAYRNRTKI